MRERREKREETTAEDTRLVEKRSTKLLKINEGEVEEESLEVNRRIIL